jgi:Ca2+-binding RTX toxin-like protein
MSRYALLLVFVTAAMLLIAGTAWASIRCTGGKCYGTDASERLVGTTVSDTIFALPGDDEVFAGTGDDKPKAGDDADTVYGAGGGDTIKGGTGGDTLYGGGNDLLYAGTRIGGVSQTDGGVEDVMDCGSGTDEVYYTPGQNTILGCEVLHPSEYDPAPVRGRGGAG